MNKRGNKTRKRNRIKRESKGERKIESDRGTVKDESKRARQSV